MKIRLAVLLLTGIIISSCSNSHLQFESDSLQVTVGESGELTGLIDKKTQTNYLAEVESSNLLSIRVNGEFETSSKATMEEGIISFYFEKSDVSIQVKPIEKKSHISFEILDVTNNEKIELITWGPYPTTINKIIGETVGVVRGEEYALGIQALNIKTLGGYPYQENDCMPEFDVFLQEDVTDLNQKGKPHVLYRIEAAIPTKTGSSLQAYCRNRDKDRIIENLNHGKFIAPAYDDGGVIGSKIALFGCPVDNALETIGEIEKSEGLPHPIIDGQWGKIAPGAAAAYIIMNFSEDDIDNALEITQQAGLKYLYHYGKTFKSWGHFELYDGAFPNGYEGLRMCSDKAKKYGISLGLHTLSNFITTNDPYVTPVPDKRLAKVGNSVIMADIDANKTEISIKSPDFFNQYKNNSLRTVQIGDELIRYGKVTEESPWKLLDCQRGAFDTKVAAHKTGDTIAKLLDHGYKVFLSNTDLTIELSKNIAELYNKTGLRQISFDGLEGNKSTGLGNYGETMMPYVWYNALSDDIKSHLITDASRTTHFFWHIYSRMNWGEPWYAGFRESQTEYRLKNQKYFKRNFMPGMLGWFKMTPETSIEDTEWLLARSAAFDAGYAFVISNESLEENGHKDKILELIGEWEKVRLAGLFTDEQKQIMEDTDTEFTLKKINNREWDLTRVFSGKFKHEKKVRQPGEPLYSIFDFTHNGTEQTLNFILNAVDSDISNIILEIDNYKEIKLTVTLKAGEIIKYTGGTKASVYDKNWQVIKEIDIDPSLFKVTNGEHSMTFDFTFEKTGEEHMVKFEIRTFGLAEIIGNIFMSLSGSSPLLEVIARQNSI